MKSPRLCPARQHGENRPLIYRSALSINKEGDEMQYAIPAVLSNE
jgi:hypothetical protein